MPGNGPCGVPCWEPPWPWLIAIDVRAPSGLAAYKVMVISKAGHGREDPLDLAPGRTSSQRKQLLLRELTDLYPPLTPLLEITWHQWGSTQRASINP